MTARPGRWMGILLWFLPMRLVASETPRPSPVAAPSSVPASTPRVCDVWTTRSGGSRLTPTLPDLQGDSHRRRRSRPALSARPDAEACLADAVAFLHEQGIAHRDLKPGNILISSKGQVKIADFGLAKGVENTLVTRTHEIVGTIKYLAPEVVVGGPSELAADLHALGFILYELISGSPPYSGANFANWLVVIRESRPRPLCERVPAVPAIFERLVFSLLVKDPGARPPASKVLSILDVLMQENLFHLETPVASAVFEQLQATPRRIRPSPDPVPPQVTMTSEAVGGITRKIPAGAGRIRSEASPILGVMLFTFMAGAFLVRGARPSLRQEMSAPSPDHSSGKVSVSEVTSSGVRSRTAPVVPAPAGSPLAGSPGPQEDPVQKFRETYREAAETGRIPMTIEG